MLMFAAAAMVLAAPQQTAPASLGAEVRGSMAPAVGHLMSGQPTVAGAMGMTPRTRSNQPPAGTGDPQSTGNELSFSNADGFDTVENLSRNDTSPEETERIAHERGAAAARIDSLGHAASNRRGAGTAGPSPSSPRRLPN